MTIIKFANLLHRASLIKSHHALTMVIYFGFIVVNHIKLKFTKVYEICGKTVKTQMEINPP